MNNNSNNSNNTVHKNPIFTNAVNAYKANPNVFPKPDFERFIPNIKEIYSAVNKKNDAVEAAQSNRPIDIWQSLINSLMKVFSTNPHMVIGSQANSQKVKNPNQSYSDILRNSFQNGQLTNVKTHSDVLQRRILSVTPSFLTAEILKQQGFSPLTTVVGASAVETCSTIWKGEPKQTFNMVHTTQEEQAKNLAKYNANKIPTNVLLALRNLAFAGAVFGSKEPAAKLSQNLIDILKANGVKIDENNEQQIHTACNIGVKAGLGFCTTPLHSAFVKSASGKPLTQVLKPTLAGGVSRTGMVLATSLINENVPDFGGKLAKLINDYCNEIQEAQKNTTNNKNVASTSNLGEFEKPFKLKRSKSADDLKVEEVGRRGK